ncbi:MAG: gfo/Idh/MocA family oxidoreductase, partial [Chloroflexi bacterium]|nr:gfo/Idh/MocA family oxidoreductase [Chloroflexota bacterium]
PYGLYVYSDGGKGDISLEDQVYRTGVEDLLKLYNAVRHNAPLVHTARWGKATVEVCLAILESSKTHKEVTLHHQVETPG